MAYQVGDVVLASFVQPVTGDVKVRPVVVMGCWECAGTFDYLVCFITTKAIADPWMKPMSPDALSEGTLKKLSYLRPTYLVTVAHSSIDRKIGVLSNEWLDYIREAIADLLAPDQT